MESRLSGCRKSQRGYTLIELLAVIGIIAMLSGVGIGLLRGMRNELERTRVALRQYARAAWLRARMQQAPTVLSIKAPDEDAELPGMLILRGLYLATEWNFDKDEQGSSRDVFGFGGMLQGGTIELLGRHGNCLVPYPDGGQSALVARLGDQSAFDFREGCLIQFDLYLDEISDCKVLDLERMIEIGVDGTGRVEARVSLQGAGAQVGSRIMLKSPQALSLKGWHRIKLRAQRGDFALLVDGVEVDHKIKKGIAGEKPAPLFWNRHGLLTISDGGLPVIGRIDSIRLYGFEVLQTEEIPPDVEIQSRVKELHFTAQGLLDPYYHPELPRFRLIGLNGEASVGFQSNGLVK